MPDEGAEEEKQEQEHQRPEWPVIFDNSSAFCSAGTLDVAEATAPSQNICRLLEQNFGLSSAASYATFLMLYGGFS